MSDKQIKSWYDHGAGDCVQWVALMQLYRQRGYSVSCHYDKNKEAIFQAGGIEYQPEPIKKEYHHWRYYPSFNTPDPTVEGSGNKCYLNLNTEWLPDLGNRDEIWRELCALDMETSFDEVITPQVREDVETFLKDLPRPIVLLHTKGTNFQEQKSIPDNVAMDLYRRLLDGMEGTIILLDWDFRVPCPNHGRIRHIKRDWGHLSLFQLAGLIAASDLLIGIDSGPFHLANMTRTPSLGVFHDFFPWCVTLPRPSGKTCVMTRDSHHHATVPRRKVWNPVEYPAPLPTAGDIAKHALRMLAGPRYGLPLGRDVMMQQMVRDMTNSHTSTSPIADRHNTLDILFRELGQVNAPSIVETGCVRSSEDWSAGYFGYLAGCFLEGKRAGNLTSVDIDPVNCATARRLCEPWGHFVSVIQSDSVKYLTARQEPIDCLYLDSLDCDQPNHSKHCLSEVFEGEKKVKEGGIIVIDDTAFAGQWTGKGALAVPYLMEKGWKMIGSGYQVILKRCCSNAKLSCL